MVAGEKNIIGKRLIHSYLSSVISITLVLVLVGAAALFAANAGEISRFFKENMVVSLILGQSVTEEEGQELTKKLTSDPQVLSADFISRERGTQEMKVLLGEDFLSVFESNPVPLSIDLHLNGDMVSRDSLVFLKSRFLAEPAVEEVVYQESLVEILNANLRKIVTILTGVVIVLLFISFVLINNTVRLNVFSRRFTIHTMRLVGATRAFIRRPFMWHALVQGAVSGLLAAGCIAAALWWSGSSNEILLQILDKRITGFVLLGVFFLGIIICQISAFFVVNKLVGISKDDLYY
jgi:cell division transport system permease protein